MADLDPRHWTAHRHYQWDEYFLVDKQDRIISSLDQDSVSGGSLELSIYGELRSSGSLKYDAALADRLNSRVKIVRHVVTAFGHSETVLAVMLAASPGVAAPGDVVTRELQLFDKSKVLIDHQFAAGLVVPAGTVVTDRMVQGYEEAGERFFVEESDAVLSSPLVLEPESSAWTLQQRLCDAIGFAAPRVSPEGVFTNESYRDPSQRGVSHEWVAGVSKYADPEMELDDFEVPNRWTVTGEVTADEDPVMGVWTNEDPGSDYSRPSRGRWIDRSSQGMSVVSVAAAEVMAQRFLRQSTPARVVRVGFLWQPVWLGEIVRFDDAEVELPGVACSVETLSLPHGDEAEDGALTAREVVSL